MRNDYVVVILWSLLKSKVTKSRPWWFFPSHPLLTILSITSGFSREGDSIEEDSPGGLVAVGDGESAWNFRNGFGRGFLQKLPRGFFEKLSQETSLRS